MLLWDFNLHTLFCIVESRLLPLYTGTIMIAVTYMDYIGFGPFNYWNQDGTNKACETNWWTNILYVNNLVNTDQMVGHLPRDIVYLEDPTIHAYPVHQ